MSTNDSTQPQMLEEDLRRQVEEDVDEDVEMQSSVPVPVQDMEAEQSTNSAQSSRKVRSRPPSTTLSDLADQPKRRKTLDEDDVNRESSTLLSDKAPGPSSSLRQSVERETKIPDKVIEEKDSDVDSEDDDDTMGLFSEENRALRLQMLKEIPRMNLDEDIYENMNFSDLPSGSKGRIDPFPIPNYSRSAGLEELFRLPLYETEDRRLIAAAAADMNKNFPVNTTEDNKNEASDPTVKEEKRMMWARKLLFLSTDVIFPGFSSAAGDKTSRNQYMAMRVRSSWVLQALLYADALLFAMWVLSFLCTIDISMSVLKELHGNLVLCMTVLFIVVNIPRLLFGFRGNERDKLELLALFWMTTLIVQGPLLSFILFTDIFTPIRLAFTIAMDSSMMMFLILEFIVGSYHLRGLIRDELKIIKVLKLSENLVSHRSTLGDPVASRMYHEQYFGNDPVQGNMENDDDDWSTDEEGDDGTRGRVVGRSANLDYKMRIHRLIQEPAEPDTNDDDDDDDEGIDEHQENDDTHLVTSTSDAVRHRSVRVN